MQPDISFLLVTKRPILEFAAKVIENIHESAKGLNYEILIYSPTEVGGEHIRWFKEKTFDGCVSGFNFLAKQALGKYVTTTVDDHGYHFYMDRALHFLESRFYEDRKIRICAVATGGNTCIPSPSRPHDQGIVPHILENNIRILGFPVINRQDCIDHMSGHIFNPKFRHHWGDNWLPYWLWRISEPHYECPNTPFYSLPNSGPQSFIEHDKRDFDVFCESIKDLEVNNKQGYVNE